MRIAVANSRGRGRKDLVGFLDSDGADFGVAARGGETR